ncbi:TldD/PmbA family protein [bacterium]|nr:TldD/PmbA family protein [bacterium]
MEIIKKLSKKILSRIPKGFSAQVDVISTTTTSLRFGNNAITQNSIGDKINISLEVFQGKKHGSSSTNRLDIDALDRLVSVATNIAMQTPEDPEAMPLLDPQAYPETPQRFFQDTADLSPNDIVEHISIVTEMAKSKGMSAGGLYQTGIVKKVLANNHGLSAEDSFTHVEYSCSVSGKTGSGYANATAESINAIEPEALARRAFATAVASENPKNIGPGDYDVVLTPQAVIDLLEYFNYYLSRRDADEGTNAFAGKLGEKVFADSINISVGQLDPEMPPPPFSDDGLPVKPTFWVKNGVLDRLPMSRFWAKEKGDTPDAIKWPFTLGGTDSTVEELIEQCGNGLFIQRFWYIEEVDARDMLLTGMTRDGVFAIENGKIAGPVKNLRFNESPMVALANAVALGKAVRVGSYFSEPHYWAKVPAILSREFTFSSSTESV